ncbi:MAG: 4Fe-4S dicluster domain-containing protein [Methanobacteriota archaeon]|nr:MAG: 4Fe-4S dicluster domain-containing protein [Euryarchaeota archaeon]
MILIDKERCVGCGHCVPFCPVEALSVWGVVKVDHGLCIGCLTCTEYCPNKALRWDEG